MAENFELERSEIKLREADQYMPTLSDWLKLEKGDVFYCLTYDYGTAKYEFQECQMIQNKPAELMWKYTCHDTGLRTKVKMPKWYIIREEEENENGYEFGDIVEMGVKEAGPIKAGPPDIKGTYFSTKLYGLKDFLGRLLRDRIEFEKKSIKRSIENIRYSEEILRCINASEWEHILTPSSMT